jgi:hypothetical protein
MNATWEQYTFTFDKSEERKFRSTLALLEEETTESNYELIKDVHMINPESPRDSDLCAVLTMEPESALTFRLGMRYLKIHKHRSDEDQAARDALIASNKITIKVKVDGMKPMST